MGDSVAKTSLASIQDGVSLASQRIKRLMVQSVHIICIKFQDSQRDYVLKILKGFSGVFVCPEVHGEHLKWFRDLCK